MSDTRTLIHNARIVDGTGNPWFRGSLLLEGDRIAAVIATNARGCDEADGPEADITVDAGGHVLCPGFIDIQSHAILPLMVDGRCLSKISQGITTEIMGEAWTPAPVIGKNLDPMAWRWVPPARKSSR